MTFVAATCSLRRHTELSEAYTKDAHDLLRDAFLLANWL